VRVTPYHLVVNFAHHIRDAETLLFAGNFGMENHLQQKITQLLGKLGIITGIERVDHFISFFDQVGAQRRVGLLAVPGAAARGAQAGLHGDQVFKSFADALL
jgi:hypothetical protein